jgi:MATE family multidrug resistance protein
MMRHVQGKSAKFQTEFGQLSRLAGPLVVNNLSIAGMNAADAMMSGRLGADALAAVAVGGSVWLMSFTLVLGVLMAISPISARYFGAGRPEMIGRYTRQGIYIAVTAGIIVAAAAQFLVEPLLVAVGIDPGFRDLTVGYTGAIAWGAPGIYIFLALRFTTEGIGRTKPIMYASLLALSCNVFLNYVLMFGHFGAPAMGAVGCGLASAITMWIVMATLAAHILIAAPYKPLKIFARLAPPRPEVLREIVVLGLPIAITITAEVGLFAAVSILVGTRGTEITAAHQVAINFASTMFMVPLALSSAITIQAGQLLGAQRFERARYSAALGIALCAVFMSLSAIVLLVFRDIVVGLYTDDAVVRNIAISLLLMAAVFQVADGVQIGAAGALRAYKDTRVPMAINIVVYWAIAFPLAFLAAVTYKAPPDYIWGGFVVGLSIAAVLLTWRFARISRRVVLQEQA